MFSIFILVFHTQRHTHTPTDKREISAHAAIYARNSVQTQRLTTEEEGPRWVNSYDMQPEKKGGDWGWDCHQQRYKKCTHKN